jgi:hypothetical protein
LPKSVPEPDEKVFCNPSTFSNAVRSISSGASL